MSRHNLTPASHWLGAAGREPCSLADLGPGVRVMGTCLYSVVWGFIGPPLWPTSHRCGLVPRQVLPAQERGWRRREAQRTSAPGPGSVHAPGPGSVRSPAMHVAARPPPCIHGTNRPVLTGTPQGSGFSCSFSVSQCARNGFHHPTRTPE